jgi:hypothetical protein
MPTRMSPDSITPTQQDLEKIVKSIRIDEIHDEDEKAII